MKTGMRGMEQVALTPSQRAQVRALLVEYLPGVTVWAYGSRVTGRARPASDLDLLVFTGSAGDLRRRVALLREVFEESDLPMRVDLFTDSEVPESFMENIRKKYAVIIGGEDTGE